MATDTLCNNNPWPGYFDYTFTSVQPIATKTDDESKRSSADPLGPGSGPWVVESPAAHGLNATLLDAAADEIWQIVDGFWQYRGLKNVSSRGCLVIAKDGALVYERYNTSGFNQHQDGPNRTPQPWSEASSQPGWSMTKTLGALLGGWAVTHGGLDLDKDITQAYGVPSPKGYPVTSRQIMSQSLGGDSPGAKWYYDAEGTGCKAPRYLWQSSGLHSSQDASDIVAHRDQHHGSRRPSRDRTQRFADLAGGVAGATRPVEGFHLGRDLAAGWRREPGFRLGVRLERHLPRLRADNAAGPQQGQVEGRAGANRQRGLHRADDNAADQVLTARSILQSVLRSAHLASWAGWSARPGGQIPRHLLGSGQLKSLDPEARL